METMSRRRPQRLRLHLAWASLGPPARLAPSLSEKEVKQAVADHLTTRGYDVTVAWGRERGVDIAAQGARGPLVVEAKGEAALQPQQVNYFLGALGELVQRMSDPDARYGPALPDNRQFRKMPASSDSVSRRGAPHRRYESFPWQRGTQLAVVVGAATEIAGGQGTASGPRS